jgi:hypothetical protein
MEKETKIEREWGDSGTVYIRFNVTPRMLQRLRENGRIRAARCGHKYLYNLHEIGAYLEAGGMDKR